MESGGIVISTKNLRNHLLGVQLRLHMDITMVKPPCWDTTSCNYGDSNIHKQCTGSLHFQVMSTRDSGTPFTFNWEGTIKSIKS